MSIEALKNPESVFVIKESLFPIDDQIAKFGFGGFGLFFLTVATFAASGLLLPHTSFGMALAYLGNPGLVIVSVGFGIAGVSSLVEAVYLHKRNALSRVSEIKQTPSEKDPGFFYKIKNRDGETVGYLFGSASKCNASWTGLEEKVQKKLEKAGKIFLEVLSRVSTEEKRQSCALHGCQIGPELLIREFAKESEKEIEGLDLEISQNLMSGVVHSYRARHAKDLNSYSDGLMTQQYMECWQKGNAKEVVRLVNEDLRNLFGYEDIHKEEYMRLRIGGRHEQWITILDTDLQNASRENKTFICVDALNLFDFPGSTGLITLLREKEWIVESSLK